MFPGRSTSALNAWLNFTTNGLGGGRKCRRYREGYLYAYPFIIGKKVISVSASICCDLDSYPSIHPSIHPSMHFVSGIVAYLVSHSCCCWSFWLSSQLESSADLSHMICYFCCSCRLVLAFNFPWNKFPSGGKRGVCQVIKIEWKKI